MHKKKLTYSILLLTLINCKTLSIDRETYDGLKDGIYANFKTSKGDLLVKLEDKKSPVTVANFVGLAEGKIDNKAKKKGEPFYDGTIFHRVIKDFMIQGGDPGSKNAPAGKALGNGGDDLARIPAKFPHTVFQKTGVLAAARCNNPEKARSDCTI